MLYAYHKMGSDDLPLSLAISMTVWWVSACKNQEVSYIFPTAQEINR